MFKRASFLFLPVGLGCSRSGVPKVGSEGQEPHGMLYGKTAPVSHIWQVHILLPSRLLPGHLAHWKF